MIIIDKKMINRLVNDNDSLRNSFNKLMDDCNKDKARNDELAHGRIKSADYDQIINE